MFVITLAIRADMDAKKTNNSINMNKGRHIKFLIAFISLSLYNYINAKRKNKPSKTYGTALY